MKNSKKLFSWLLGLLALVLITTSCVYEQIEPVKVDEVSWSEDILPILSNRCSTTSCHIPGDVSPDLSEANAYISLVYLGYVDIEDPENSQIYLQITVGRMKDVEMTELEKAQILEWIRNGALEE